jgi:hypothetical protein
MKYDLFLLTFNIISVIIFLHTCAEVFMLTTDH